MYKILGKKTKRSKYLEKILFQFNNIDEVVSYVKGNKLVATRPYIFTRLDLSDGTIIKQEVMGMSCSPTSLAELLEAKQTY